MCHATKGIGQMPILILFVLILALSATKKLLSRLMNCGSCFLVFDNYGCKNKRKKLPLCFAKNYSFCGWD
jgi:hypothetical protein